MLELLLIRLATLAVLACVGAYLTPGLAAMRHWMCTKRDVWANQALIAKRDRR